MAEEGIPIWLTIELALLPLLLGLFVWIVKLSASLSKLNEWRDNHQRQCESVEGGITDRLDSMGGKIDGIARDLNQLIGKTEGNP